MTRDYSHFLPGTAAAPPHRPTPSRLDMLGWQPFFASQITLDALTQTPPVRVVEIHRSGLRVMGETIETTIPPGLEATVGDWLLYDAVLPTASTLLERKSVLKRRAPGHDRRVQLIAANIDTAFIVTSCNADFNVARLERYIALAFEAEIDPVIVITKPDLADNPQGYLEKAEAISAQVPALLLDARGDDPTTRLAPWCGSGRTIAFLGSSGVGKSTLTNALLGQETAATRGIRDDDAKGRHTTTSRHLHIRATGCAILDTPGMRELQLTEASAGLRDVFDDLATLAADCRFRDCRHDTEPGCAVQAALARGEIEAERLGRWRKLVAEDALNTATLAERRSKDRKFGKMIKGIQKTNRKKR
ncbi:ribosome small subunit-dependent GTPase A [Cognatishimia sp. F0-27]|uniref:ribosome small subunit-dependent GTPase A n=1 Tax=Cognatishimia sp. F0-27 TaxID=2816855 RepID=UPI001D0CA3BE|nr:ribosome small subunit-dependent GTPase A [Cognatishimia sp. F0-27]MCC1494579.1 ribosome small subunit-dependent GTPase A [Cognatishimia sp. F0-27]